MSLIGEAREQRKRHETPARKLGSGGLSSLLEKPQHSGSSECLLCRVDQRGECYCIQLNKKSGVINTDKRGGRVYGGHLDQVGLVSLSRSSL